MQKNNRLKMLMIILILTATLIISCGIFGQEPTPTNENPSLISTQVPFPTATITLAPTVSVAPQKPAVIESYPEAGSELALDGKLTLYFNQPMDQESVQNGLSFDTEGIGSYAWQNDSTLDVFPAAQFSPAKKVNLLIKGEIMASNGLALDEDMVLSFTTVDELLVVDMLPLDGAAVVDPGSAILISFNRPVVALGEEQETAPAPFTLVPETQGRGGWVNTSTYIFYPDPILEGDTGYEVIINSGLTAVDLAPLNNAPEWTFSTSAPIVRSVYPEAVNNLALDPELTILFNHPMDTESVESNWAFTSASLEEIQGSFEWNEDHTEVVFTPLIQLPRGTAFTLSLLESMTNAAGSPLSSIFVRQFVTIPDFAIIGTNPQSGQYKEKYSSVHVNISSLMGEEDFSEHILIEPEVDIYVYDSSDKNVFYINGNFDYSTHYTVTVLGTLEDAYGQALGSDYTFDFYTGAASPELNLNIWYANGVLFTRPETPVMGVQALNINHMDVKVQSINFAEFNYLFNQAIYDAKETYSGTQVAFWRHFIENQQNRFQIIEVPLMPDEQDLPTGVYLYDITSQEANQAGDYQDLPFFVVSSNVHLTFKIGPTELMVWAVDMRTNQPVGGESLQIYDINGQIITQGLTDVDGVFYAQIEERENPYENSTVVMGNPGDELFSLAISNWGNGLSGWDFGLRTSRTGARPYTYLYTDRPIYRPGQTVYFKGIIRELFDGQYSLTEFDRLPITISVEFGDKIADIGLEISEFGTAEGTFVLPDDLEPGSYRINSQIDNDYGSVRFIVANYRKPEFEVSVNWPSAEVISGMDTTAEISANYYFGAPTSNTDLTWSLYKRTHYFYLPGYRVGPTGGGGAPYMYVPEISPLGDTIDSGTGTTGVDGLLSIDLVLEAGTRPSELTLEATVMDESGFPVSGREEIIVHPGEYYIGARSEGWIGETNQPMGFEIMTVDWDRNPTGEKTLLAEFFRVSWVRTAPDRWGYYWYDKELDLEASANFTTGADGKARLEFIPADPGTYQLTISDGDIVTELLVWVTGRGNSFWSSREENQIELQLDQVDYQPGETAEIFIPNPFGEGAVALITVERSTFFRREVIQIAEGGDFFALPLSAAEAPNVFVSATILGTNEFGDYDLRQGYIQINVEPSAQTLTVEISREPEVLEPGATMTMGIRVLDDKGAPVEGEFSVAIVDKAVLELADPNSVDILTAFYEPQPLGIRTNASQIASTARFVPDVGGLGGGGGGLEDAMLLRDDFEDTAYWQADVITDANGLAELVIPMPDNLTTWHILVRGVTVDTLVGEAEVEVISTKPLLIRPVTPRFFIENDHVEIAGIVHNNTGEELSLTVSMAAEGFTLDDPDESEQTFTLPSGERARVSWCGTVDEVEYIDFTFGVSGGEWNDYVIPENGSIPVYEYVSPKTYGSSGMLAEEGEILELVSIPKSMTVTGGDLNVSIQTSLTAVLADSLTALLEAPKYENIEQKVSRVLSTIVMAELYQSANMESPVSSSDLQDRIDGLLVYLAEKQQKSGGWGWTESGKVNSYITSYVVYALQRIESSGYLVKSSMLNPGYDYLNNSLPAINMLANDWQYDRLAFQLYVLTEGERNPISVSESLFLNRDSLSPWGKAYLALALWNFDETDPDMATLISDLAGESMVSASGVHWDHSGDAWWNMDSPVFNNAVVVYALTQIAPDSNLLDDAVRYLMLIREGGNFWSSSYDTSWVMLAADQYVRLTGDWDADFEYYANLNNEELLSGEADSATGLRSESLPLTEINHALPNALEIGRGEGDGRLYYSAYLQVKTPVDEIEPIANGVFIEREYYVYGEDCIGQDCQSVLLGNTGDLLLVRLSLTLPNDLHNVIVEDYLPAGAEAVAPTLLTSQLGLENSYDDSNPFVWGWYWWVFDRPNFYDHKVTWSAEYLQAGTYELTYILRLAQPGEFQVLPARIWQLYFPDIQATTAGEILVIEFE